MLCSREYLFIYVTVAFCFLGSAAVEGASLSHRVTSSKCKFCSVTFPSFLNNKTLLFSPPPRYIEEVYDGCVHTWGSDVDFVDTNDVIFFYRISTPTFLPISLILFLVGASNYVAGIISYY